jgi:hypothetical protein
MENRGTRKNTCKRIVRLFSWEDLPFSPLMPWPG